MGWGTKLFPPVFSVITKKQSNYLNEEENNELKLFQCFLYVLDVQFIPNNFHHILKYSPVIFKLLCEKEIFGA